LPERVVELLINWRIPRLQHSAIAPLLIRDGAAAMTWLIFLLAAAVIVAVAA
jgi:hypothetical protein